MREEREEGREVESEGGRKGERGKEGREVESEGGKGGRKGGR